MSPSNIRSVSRKGTAETCQDSEDESHGSFTETPDVGKRTKTSLVRTQSAADRIITKCELVRLERQKRLIEEASSIMEAVVSPERQRDNRSKPTRPDREVQGPKLPGGVKGLGPTGTWVISDNWQLDLIPSTTELPTVRLPWEGQAELEIDNSEQEEVEVENLLLNGVSQESNSSSRTLTPLPSFVTGE